MPFLSIHIHPRINDDKLDEVLRTLHKLHSHIDYLIKQQKEMANEINAYLDRVEAAVEGIRQDIQDIKDGMNDGGLSAAEVAQIKERLSGVVERVEALDAENTRPEEPEEPGEGPVPA